MAQDSIQIKVTGRKLTPTLPTLLRPTARSTAQNENEFLPAGYLTPKLAFDVGATARSAGDSVTDSHAAAGDEVVVLELADGSTFITSAEKLRSSLARTRPDLLGPDGEILLEKLRAETGAARGIFGDAIGGLVSKVFSFVVGGQTADVIQTAKDQAVDVALLGVSWLGTKALMLAIENKLKPGAGLYRWSGSSGSVDDLKPAGAPKDFADADEAAKKPILVFLHGTGSSTLGSFGALRASGPDLWAALEHKYPDNVYAFEHRTLSDSPITNALELARALPRFAHISLVTHSRGGLVGDLLCLADFASLIERYRFDKRFEGIGDADADADEIKRVKGELDSAHAGHRAELRELAELLRNKQFTIRRYVRAASPAHGTLLASGNFDLFLSGLLTLIGQVPFLFGSPIYSAFKRVVIDIAKNRTNPHLVPGIEAMLPDSPMASLLREAPVRPGIEMAVIAGDIQGGNLLKRLGVLLTDFIFFDNIDNDLVVDTPAMLAGIAPKAGARVLFDRGADVSHFRYFANQDTRVAMRDWLICDKPASLKVFHPLPDRIENLQALQRAISREAQAEDRPVVVVLPGVMGSHLRVGAKDRVWLDVIDIAAGGLDKIAWGKSGVEAEELFGMFYGALCAKLAESHRVETFAYDWRQPMDVLAERLGEFLDRLLKQTRQPIRLLAHSMGGLVVRSCIHKRRAVMDALMKRDGARLVMLGTPNQGAHSMVENLLGKGTTLRTLVRLDLAHSMQEVLDIVAGFRGALQLLPKPGFKDIFQGQSDGGGFYDYQVAGTWGAFKPKLSDLWFGNGKVGQPAQDTLDSASWLWTQDGKATPALPADYEKKASYVFGVARNTPCGVREENGRLRMVGTTRGDGTVTWESGRIGGIGQFFYMHAEHGDLLATKEHFPALVELLTTGNTGQLPKTPPATRDIELAQPVLYDAGPPTADNIDAAERALLGGSMRQRAMPRPKRRLEVCVKADDLRFLDDPILVGHYQQDPITGPEALVDRELLDGELSERHSLGLYAGPRGTATVVLRIPNEFERRRGSMRGAVVTGLGSYDTPLSQADLTSAVRAGVLRYLLQMVDVLGKEECEVTLATLLIGYNSSANLSIGASVEALVRGVIDANASFYETTRLNLRVAKLQIVELYLDTAITAVYELRQMADKLAAAAERHGTLLVCQHELERGESARQRLFDSRSVSYWPRLVVTDADRDDETCPPECFARQCPPECYEDPCDCDDADDDAKDGGSDGKSGGTAGTKRPQDGDSRARIADRLRYLYIGARARAESVAQQRQPGLIETLVRQQIHVKTWQEDIGRMLFQLMVPHDFKDAARQMDRLVLVVDSYTANLPWELMLADDPSGRDADRRPLALRTAVVRQLASSRFRRQVRQVMNHEALVIGNPSVAGFGAAFPRPKGRKRDDPPQLPGAQTESEAVALALGGLGYNVQRVIGEEAVAIEVFARLYQRPYRILHISAHGVFGVRHQDGRLRSGVVLSDGLLITAAEIEAMESVPELVFLNCCHLGTVDTPVGRGANRLAASVSRELIAIGVRCVIVAGWAVDDDCARVFGQTFYEQLLLRGRNFGDAVFEARQAAWKHNPADITWGAFQAYGEPGWLAEPRADGAGAGGDARYVSPDELLDALARVRADLKRRPEKQSPALSRAQADHVARLLDKRCPPGWQALPEVQSALAATWRELGDLDKAREAYLKAIQAEGDLGRVPVKDLEQLANVEARLGERMAGMATDTKSERAALALVRLAITRLRKLDEIVGGQPDSDTPSAAATVSSERSALLGSAYKRLASVFARKLLKPDLEPDERPKVAKAMGQALVDSVEAYRSAEGSSADGRLKPYLALNRLALDALTPWEDTARHTAAIALAHQCRLAAEQAFMSSASVWDAVMQPEAVLVESLLDGSFGKGNDDGEAAFEGVVNAYLETLKNLPIKPSELDSVLAQIDLLSRFYDAHDVAQHDAQIKRAADRLVELVQRLQPSRPRRTDRPGAKPAAPPAQTADTPPPDEAAVDTPPAGEPAARAPASRSAPAAAKAGSSKRVSKPKTAAAKKAARKK